MKVAGYTVPPEVEARLVERMRAGAFTADDLRTLAREAGIPRTPAYYLSDRLIQPAKRKGCIEKVQGVRGPTVSWSWRHPAASPAGREG